MNDNVSSVKNRFLELVENAKDLYLPSQIPTLHKPPTAFEFYKNFVSKNRPCIIKNACNDWPAMTNLWTNNYLRKTMTSSSSKISPDNSSTTEHQHVHVDVECNNEMKNDNDAMITVTMTPNGLADAVIDISEHNLNVSHNKDGKLSNINRNSNHKRWFVYPKEVQMPFCDFVDFLEEWHLHKSDVSSNTKEEIVGNGSTFSNITSSSSDENGETNNNDDSSNNNNDHDKNACHLCNCVLYCQLQNGCMTSEYAALLDDISLDFNWANEAFDNKKPDAINFWMGENRSISSLHQDPFENLYCVVTGKKIFTLYPPTDEYFIEKKQFPKGTYQFDSKLNKWYIVAETDEKGNCEMHQWIDLHDKNNCPYLNDNDNDDGELCKQCKYRDVCNCYSNVVVECGDMLYLPAQWFHQVEQECDKDGRCIAVNFWYDMSYDVRWNLVNFMKRQIYSNLDK